MSGADPSPDSCSTTAEDQSVLELLETLLPTGWVMFWTGQPGDHAQAYLARNPIGKPHDRAGWEWDEFSISVHVVPFEIFLVEDIFPVHVVQHDLRQARRGGPSVNLMIPLLHGGNRDMYDDAFLQDAGNRLVIANGSGPDDIRQALARAITLACAEHELDF